ncbi:shTK domain protein [Ancylostoma duodenale]|uniref:ShTK domain protein n=1 Tax=Ancylostoma duodenale TaxID=51022 RepID=A0A0C2FBD6_9BILA|nr:shTK domain protein [Ancylostoma duodenale]
MLLLCFFLTSFSCLVLAKEDCDKSIREDRCNEIFNNIEYCNQESYRPQLMDCLVTCGKCGAFSCNNPLPETSLNCTALASQCNSTVWERFMKEKCPSTCGKCDVKNANLCKDATDSIICSTMVQFCNSLDFYDQMTEQCASTCNRCPSSGQNGEAFYFGDGDTTYVSTYIGKQSAVPSWS